MASYMKFYTVVVSDDNGDTLWSGEFSTEDLMDAKYPNLEELTIDNVLETAWNQSPCIPLEQGCDFVHARDRLCGTPGCQDNVGRS